MNDLDFQDLLAFRVNGDWRHDTPFRDEDGWIPGTVLRNNNGDLFLVGDVNPLLGTCDDCKHCIKDDDITAASHLSFYRAEKT